MYVHYSLPHVSQYEGFASERSFVLECMLMLFTSGIVQIGFCLVYYRKIRSRRRRQAVYLQVERAVMTHVVAVSLQQYNVSEHH